MAEPDSQTADRAVRGVCISDLITGSIFTTASLNAVPECADGRALTGIIWSIKSDRFFCGH
jgi:hypothetical protein